MPLLQQTWCYRWSSQHMSKVVQYSYSGMGGVDQFDQFMGKLRPSFRKRVWYYPLVRFVLNASVVIGRLIYQKFFVKKSWIFCAALSMPC